MKDSEKYELKNGIDGFDARISSLKNQVSAVF